ncbi:MAG: hypothetical protein ACRENW_00730, partial [Thermodesulfobacteriota bacterium]
MFFSNRHETERPTHSSGAAAGCQGRPGGCDKLTSFRTAYLSGGADETAGKDGGVCVHGAGYCAGPGGARAADNGGLFILL